MSGELDQVSQAIGELKGLMEGHGRELGGIKADVSEIKAQYTELNRDGCSRGNTNARRIDQAEDMINAVQAGRIGGKEYGRLGVIGAVISGVVVGLVEAVRALGK